MKLSEQRAQSLEAWAKNARGEFVSIGDIALQFAELHELIRGYRRAAALEDAARVLLTKWDEVLPWPTLAAEVDALRSLLAEGDE